MYWQYALLPPSRSPPFYLIRKKFNYSSRLMPCPSPASKDDNHYFPSSSSFRAHPMPSSTVAPKSPSLQNMELLGSAVPTSNNMPREPSFFSLLTSSRMWPMNMSRVHHGLCRFFLWLDNLFFFRG